MKGNWKFLKQETKILVKTFDLYLANQFERLSALVESCCNNNRLDSSLPLSGHIYKIYL